MKSYHPPSALDNLQYFITPAHDCSYLVRRSARMVFLDPAVQKIDTVTLSELSRTGFRRSGEYIYRPECHLCRQCLSSRVPVATFQPNSLQKKAYKRNQDLRLHLRPTTQVQDFHYDLYDKYIRLRHADGDMFPPDYDQFEKFILNNCTHSFFLELWKDEQLLSVATCDQLDDGISAVYTFFDPDESRRSLGVFSILQQIDYVKAQGLNYLYLGYWVPHSNRMNYKAQYTPIEILIDGEWHSIEKPLAQDEVQRLGDSLLTTLPRHFRRR